MYLYYMSIKVSLLHLALRCVLKMCFDVSLWIGVGLFLHVCYMGVNGNLHSCSLLYCVVFALFSTVLQCVDMHVSVAQASSVPNQQLEIICISNIDPRNRPQAYMNEQGQVRTFMCVCVCQYLFVLLEVLSIYISEEPR